MAKVVGAGVYVTVTVTGTGQLLVFEAVAGNVDELDETELEVRDENVIDEVDAEDGELVVVMLEELEDVELLVLVVVDENEGIVEQISVLEYM